MGKVVQRMILTAPIPDYKVVGYPSDYAAACAMAVSHCDGTVGIYGYGEEGSRNLRIIKVVEDTAMEIMPKFAPDEQVRFINSNGVDWGIRTVVSVAAITYGETGIGYIIKPHDAPWYPVPEDRLHKLTDGVCPAS